MADKPIVLLLAKEAAHVALGKLELAEHAKDEHVETRVPEPLELVAFFRRHNVTKMGPEQGRVPFLDIGEHKLSDQVFEMILFHSADPCMVKARSKGPASDRGAVLCVEGLSTASETAHRLRQHAL